jgi:hypothetical protein
MIIGFPTLFLNIPVNLFATCTEVIMTPANMLKKSPQTNVPRLQSPWKEEVFSFHQLNFLSRMKYLRKFICCVDRGA